MHINRTKHSLLTFYQIKINWEINTFLFSWNSWWWIRWCWSHCTFIYLQTNTSHSLLPTKNNTEQKNKNKTNVFLFFSFLFFKHIYLVTCFFFPKKKRNFFVLLQLISTYFEKYKKKTYRHLLFVQFQGQHNAFNWQIKLNFNYLNKINAGDEDSIENHRKFSCQRTDTLNTQ